MVQTVGIDLGTTYSAVALFSDAGVPEILKNREGEDVTPSVVLFQPGEASDEPLVGSMAKHSAGTNPSAVVQFVKRFMGDPSWKFDAESGASYSAEEVSAIILRRLKEDAEIALGHAVTDAVITVPAYFDDARRTATKHAGEIAGLNVVRVLNEPTAAALSYGLDKAGSDGLVLVYDLGGGTFDVTLMRLTGQDFDVIATDGDRNLGGFDFDNRLSLLVAEKIQRQGGPDVLDNDESMGMLREKSELAKRSLTTVESVPVHLTAGGNSYKAQISRAEFEEASADLVRRTQEIVSDVLGTAGVTWAQIDHLLLVGGSTRMPMIKKLVETSSGRTAERSVDPDKAVALGAAVQAAIEESAGYGAGSSSSGPPLDISVSDVCSMALGVISYVETVTGDKEINSVIVPKNSKIPARVSEEYYTMEDYQTGILVRVTEAEKDEEDPRFAVVLGEQSFSIPPYKKGAPVRISFNYDIDQTVFVEVEDATAGKSLGFFEIDRASNMSREDVEEARGRIGDISVS